MGWAYLDANPNGVPSILGPYNDEEEYSKRVREFYGKRIDQLIDGLGIEDARIELLREVK